MAKKKQGTLLMRHPKLGSDGVFRRTIRAGRGGNSSFRLEFEAGIPVEVNASQLEQLSPDIGLALVLVRVDEKDRPRVLWDETDAAQGVSVPVSAAAKEPDPPEPEAVDLSPALMAAFKKNEGKFSSLSEEGIWEFLVGGGKLEDLEGFTPELVSELFEITGLSPSEIEEKSAVTNEPE